MSARYDRAMDSTQVDGGLPGIVILGVIFGGLIVAGLAVWLFRR